MHSEFSARVLVGVALAVVLLGCEEDIVLVKGTEGAFTLYGVLNPERDTQYVHAFSIEGSLERNPGDRIDARFTSLDRTTGNRMVWRDTLVADQLGERGLVFWTPLRVEYEHVYDFEITSTDGRSSRVDGVVVPPRVTTAREHPRTQEGVHVVPIRIIGGAPRVLTPTVTFTALGSRLEETEEGALSLNSGEITISYEGRPFFVNDEWWIPVDLSEAGLEMIKRLQDREVTITGATVDLIVPNEEWDPPDGAFNPEDLVHSSVLTNVENGHGFITSGYQVRYHWSPGFRMVVGPDGPAPADVASRTDIAPPTFID